MRILAMPADQGGCGHYRVRQPMNLLKAYTEHDTHVVDLVSDDMVSVTKAMMAADVALVRQGGEDGMRRMREMPEMGHLKWVLDIDDNIELISPYSEHYSEYGTREFTHNGVKVWEDGNTFEITANQARVDSLLFGMQEADLVTATTPVLAEYARQYNDNVVALPNLVDTAVWWPLPTPVVDEPRRLRIGWSGGVSHYEDWYTIKKPLNELLRKYRFTLVAVGAHFPGIIDKELRKYVEVWPWVGFQAHSYRMMCMNLDIAVIPLADLPFNHYKSPIKFLEFAAMGCPSVVANVTPYKEEVKDGHTALTYDSPERFYDQLERLIISPTLRLAIGGNARSHVINNREAKTNAHLWPDAYQAILT